MSDSVSDALEELIPEKPIKIVMGGDAVVTTTPRGKNKKVIRPPPPVYGSFRESKVSTFHVPFVHTWLMLDSE